MVSTLTSCIQTIVLCYVFMLLYIATMPVACVIKYCLDVSLLILLPWSCSLWSTRCCICHYTGSNVVFAIYPLHHHPDVWGDDVEVSLPVSCTSKTTSCILVSCNYSYICDQACENQPCECKKIADFLSLLYHNLLIFYVNKTKCLLLLQNLMGFLLQVMETNYINHNWRYYWKYNFV